MTEWAEYHQKSVGLGPRPLLLQAIELFSEPGRAVDLGAGTGRDSVFLLSRGWTVLAIDTQQPALDRLRASISTEFLSRCENRCESMESADLGEADLINAAFSLPFCDPAKVQSTWAKIQGALRPGGLFVGQFFGPQDAWAETGLWTVSKDEITALLSSGDIQSFSEFEGMRRTSAGPEKWSHVFDVIARRRAV